MGAKRPVLLGHFAHTSYLSEFSFISVSQDRRCVIDLGELAVGWTFFWFIRLAWVWQLVILNGSRDGPDRLA